MNIYPSISSTLISTHQPLNSHYICWSQVVLARWTLIHDMEWLFILGPFAVIDVPYVTEPLYITIVHLVTACGVHACMQ